MMRGLFRAGGIPLNTVLVTLRIAVLTTVGIILLPLLIDRIGKAPTGLFVFATTFPGYFPALDPLGRAPQLGSPRLAPADAGDRRHRGARADARRAHGRARPVPRPRRP